MDPQNPMQQDNGQPQQMNAPAGHPPQQPQQMPQQQMQPGMPQQQMNPMGQMPNSGSGSGLAIASLVLGIIGLLTFWTIFGGIILGLIGIILGIIGIVQKQGAMAIVGTVLSVLAIIASIILIVVAVNVVDKCETDASFRAENLQQCLDIES